MSDYLRDDLVDVEGPRGHSYPAPVPGMTDNVRLVDSDGNVDSSWTVRPGDSSRVEWSWNLLADYRRAEPEVGWHLETRGEITQWHDWER